MSSGVFDLQRMPVHLGLGATATVEPPFGGGMAWYEGYAERHASDGAEGRLVSLYTFSESWTSWEVHPNGHELVVCVAGRITLVQELADGTTRTTTLEPQQAVINEPGVWHTADIAAGTSATVLFITAGAGTQHRPR